MSRAMWRSHHRGDPGRPAAAVLAVILALVLTGCASQTVSPGPNRHAGGDRVGRAIDGAIGRGAIGPGTFVGEPDRHRGRVHGGRSDAVSDRCAPRDRLAGGRRHERPRGPVETRRRERFQDPLAEARSGPGAVRRRRPKGGVRLPVVPGGAPARPVRHGGPAVRLGRGRVPGRAALGDRRILGLPTAARRLRQLHRDPLARRPCLLREQADLLRGATGQPGGDLRHRYRLDDPAGVAGQHLSAAEVPRRGPRQHRQLERRPRPEVQRQGPPPGRRAEGLARCHRHRALRPRRRADVSGSEHVGPGRAQRSARSSSPAASSS